MQIQFFGAAGTVTGSCYLLSVNSQNILIDCGMFQGNDVSPFNYEPLPFDPKSLSFVVLTHAHLDHCGRLPLLLKGGFDGKIFMTQATKLLVGIALLDAVKVANWHTEHQPLYTEDDVRKTLQHIEIISYDQIIIRGELRITFRNAGHILGSASIEIHDGLQTILFSGDLGNPLQKLLQPTAYVPQADIVIMESTYGDRIHLKIDALTQLQQEISLIEHSKGVLLLPAFALDRTQVLLHLINHLKRDGKIQKMIPVYLDSPMGIRATMVYKECKALWSDELQHHSDDPFSFPELFLTEEAKESEQILKVAGPKIIIAGNGMMNGGRIWHHLLNYLPLDSTRLLSVGYQGVGTVGREIIEGIKRITLYHETISVNATINTMEGLSAHADQSELCAWIRHIHNIEKLFITHGDDQSRNALAEKISQSSKITDIILPTKDAAYSF